jgi:DNA-binding PadR family transcriptional regulator
MSDQPQRKTAQQISVLSALAQHQDGQDLMHGLRLCQLTALPSGTVYPMLRNFEKKGLVRSFWEDIDPKVARRPKRRLYQLTPTGEARLAEWGAISQQGDWAYA